MRISDGSSDVCSSDLRRSGPGRRPRRGGRCGEPEGGAGNGRPPRHPPGDSADGRQYLRRGEDAGDQPADALRPAEAISDAELAAAESSLRAARSEEHTSELQSLMRISYAVFCLKKKKKQTRTK